MDPSPATVALLLCQTEGRVWPARLADDSPSPGMYMLDHLAGLAFLTDVVVSFAQKEMSFWRFIKQLV